MSGFYDTLFRRALYPAYESGLRRRKTLAYLREYDRDQWRSADEIDALQWRKLQRAIAHCWQRVPFYRDWWGQAGVGAAADIRSRDELPENDWRRNDPRYSEENLPANLAIVDAIAGVAAKHGVSNAQIALAWLLAQGDDIVPIPGTKRRVTMEDSVAAADVTLTAEDLATIDAAAPMGGTSGPRYGEMGMRMVRL